MKTMFKIITAADIFAKRYHIVNYENIFGLKNLPFSFKHTPWAIFIFDKKQLKIKSINLQIKYI